MHSHTNAYRQCTHIHTDTRMHKLTYAGTCEQVKAQARAALVYKSQRHYLRTININKKQHGNSNNKNSSHNKTVNALNPPAKTHPKNVRSGESLILCKWHIVFVNCADKQQISKHHHKTQAHNRSTPFKFNHSKKFYLKNSDQSKCLTPGYV